MNTQNKLFIRKKEKNENKRHCSKKENSDWEKQ